MKKTGCFVLDCSVTMAWILRDERMSEKADAVLLSLDEKHAKVPTIWSLEVANVLCLAERQKKLTSIEVAKFKEFLAALSIQIDHDTSSKASNSP